MLDCIYIYIYILLVINLFATIHSLLPTNFLLQFQFQKNFAHVWCARDQSYKNTHISFVNSVSPSCPSCPDFHSTTIIGSDKFCKQTLCRWTGICFMSNNLFQLCSVFWLSKSGQIIIDFFFQWDNSPTRTYTTSISGFRSHTTTHTNTQARAHTHTHTHTHTR